MQLSVVIVNYNVKYFLEQALRAIYQSKTTFDFEVFVVDNHSVDGSVEMVRQQFPQVELIASKENLGFSKGNNLAIRKAQGKYVLLLNPDTIIKEDSLQKVVDFMEAHDDAGGLGVKMMDGEGNFLPESKRGFPTPYVAFCKMTGLSKLFPKSKRFNQYHLGFLDKNTTHKVDVLSGAFMLLRKSLIDEIGSLDEDYFMYGEDIDLSYRIKKAGFENYYFADTEIIHFKGESTKKGSFNYVRMFYNAMIIFAKKHLSGSKATYLTSLLSLAIYARASLAFVRRSVERFAWPVMDAALIFGGMQGLRLLWEQVIKMGINFPATYNTINIPLYIGIWLLTFFFRGGYDKPIQLKKILEGIGFGTVIILAVYALLPLHLRTSRGQILLGALAAIVLMFAARLIYFTVKGELKNALNRTSRLLIIADGNESKRIQNIIQQADLNKELVGVANNDLEDQQHLGRIEDVVEMVQVHQIDEIIFSLKAISNKEVMRIMSALGGSIQYKIISEGSDVIIGSHSKDRAGDLYTLDINFKLNQPYHRRTKRFFDVASSVVVLALSPILIWLMRHKIQFLRNCLNVLLGNKTWVGYDKRYVADLPNISTSVVTIADKNEEERRIINQQISYAKNYNWWLDLSILIKKLRQLG